MKPGELLDDGIFLIRACAVLNDLDVSIGIPDIIFEKVKENSKVTPEWPLGVYALFVEDGILLGIHGKDSDGDTTDKYSFYELKEDELPELGEEIWVMWKSLRGTSDEVVEENYQKLLKQTLGSSN